MTRKNLLTIAVSALILSGFFYASSSWAACSQVDGAGRWNVYVSIPNTTNSWIYCSFTVASNGAIATGTRCTYTNNSFRTVQAGSKLTVGSSCIASAKVVLSGGVITTFNNMTFSRDKLQFSGVGSDNFGVKFTYNGIKL